MTEPGPKDAPQAPELSAAYAAAPRPAPPAELDARIGAAARAAVQGRPRKPRVWQGGLSAAAVVVLAATVYLLMPGEPLRQSDSPRSLAPAEPGLAESDAVEAKSRRAAPAAAPARAPLDDDSAGGTAGTGQSLPATLEAPPLDPAPAQQDLRRERTASEAGAEFDPDYYRATPQLWQTHIQRLLSEGRLEEAGREFEAFRRSHPAHPYAAN